MGHVSGEQAQNSLVLLFFKRHAPFCFPMIMASGTPMLLEQTPPYGGQNRIITSQTSLSCSLSFAPPSGYQYFS